jgi:hypothetical protein
LITVADAPLDMDTTGTATVDSGTDDGVVA